MNLLSILFALLLFGFMIFIHEFGHFTVAKWAGVRVNEFSVGMGPAIISKKRKGTKYSLRAIPIGGYVALEGEEQKDEENMEDETDPSEEVPEGIGLYECPAWKRILIMAAGGIMNVFLGFVIIGILSAQQQYYGTATVAKFTDDAVTSEYLMVEDTFLSVNGEKVSSYYDLVFSLARDSDGVISAEVLRDGERVSIPEIRFTMAGEDKGSIYLDFRVYATEADFVSFVRNTFQWTGSLIKLVWRSVFDLIRGEFSLKSLSGPVGITSEISKAAKTVDFDGILLIIGLITVNLGVMNLLPLPALDGGRIVFALIELVTGFAVNRKVESIIHSVGLALLLALSIYVAYNDIVRIVTGG